MLGWGGVVRLGLVQTALGAVIVLTTSTLNRIMVVELMLPAMIPGALITLYQAIQLSRPRFGHGSDQGGRRTPWIKGGMLALALGGAGAAAGTAWAFENTSAGLTLVVLSFVLIGLGVGAAGTSLLVFLAKRVEPGKRAPAASIVWIMMIAGFAVTAGVAGQFLDPFSPARLVAVSSTVSVLAVVVTWIALAGLEQPQSNALESTTEQPARNPFFSTLRSVWQEAETRNFTLFVFASMLAYSAQDLILEPYAGALYGLTPGQSTSLAGMQNAGMLVGMLTVAFAGALGGRGDVRQLRNWTVGGCVTSALALFGLAYGGTYSGTWPLHANVVALGICNGAFAVSAIASMMALAGMDGQREGLRMGLWGAAQAIALGVGGFAGTVAIDAMRMVLTDVGQAYAVVFSAEGALFIAAALIGVRIRQLADRRSPARTPGFGEIAMGEVFDGR